MSVLVSTIGLVFVNETTAYESGLPGIFLHEFALVSGVGQIDGQAQMLASSIGLSMGAAEMDGHAQVSASSVLTSTGAARMDGQAQVSAIGLRRSLGVAMMDGRASMVIGISVPGAGISEITGVASMAARTPYNVYMSETINLIGAINNRMRFINVLQGITIVLTDNLTAHTRYHHVFTTPIGVQSMLVPGWNAVLNLVQNLIINQTTSQKFIWGRILKEAFKVSGAAGASGIYKKILAQLFKLSDIGGFSHTIAVALSQNIHLSLSLVGGFSLKLLQKFLVATTSSPVFHYHLALAGRVVTKDILGHFASAILTQLFTVHPAVNRQFVANNSLAQLLTVHPALNSKLVLQIVGNLQLSPSQLVHMLYKGDPLLDGVVITALYISPSGTTTTWVVNTRTNAVTEYLNYDFQSFALMGNRYIAAGTDGLYELDGDTDDGALIISELMSGYLQLNEKKLFGIKGAYVAIRGGGRFYLKLISGDGREYVYELKAQPNLMTTKVRIGKGISTSYMAFDLVTEGQDFDLDSIEFMPMARGRRV